MGNSETAGPIARGVLYRCLALFSRFKPPSGFARSSQGLIFIAFCFLAALLCSLLGYVSYRSSLANFMRDEVSEQRTAFELIDAFVNTYAVVMKDTRLGQFPVPQSFRALALEQFDRARRDQALRMKLVGVPGRELGAKAPDEDAATRINALAAAATPSMTEYFVAGASGPILRTLYPSIATQKSCVDCHNKLQPGEQKWRLNDVMGAFVLDTPIAGVLREAMQHAVTMALAVFLASCFLAFQLMVLNYRRTRSEIDRHSHALLAEAIESFRDRISVYDAEGRLILSNPVRTQQRDPGDSQIAQTPDGRWLQIRQSRTASGSLVRVESDITGLMQHEAALRRAKDEAETANRAKSEFLAMMSHELRTPLNAIIGFSDVMREQTFGRMPPRYLGYAKDINDSGHHLLRLISDILDMSKLEAGKAELAESICDIAATVKRCRRLVAERAQRGGLTINIRVARDLPALWADEFKLRQIILNLLSNAVKFTPSGGHITLSAKDLGPSEAGGLIIEIADNGIGMAPENIPIALAPFRQLHDQLGRKYEGTGLGLPLCKGLVELHGGVLELKSEIGVGTTATIRFPAWRRRPPVAEAEEGEGAPTPAIAALAPPPERRQRRNRNSGASA